MGHGNQGLLWVEHQFVRSHLEVARVGGILSTRQQGAEHTQVQHQGEATVPHSL